MSSIRANKLFSLVLLLGAACNTDKPQAEPPQAAASAQAPSVQAPKSEVAAVASAAASANEPSAEAVANALTGTLTGPQAASTSAGQASAGGKAAAGSPAGGNAPADGASAAGTPVTGPVVTGEGFSVHLQADPNYTVGKPGNVRVVLKATAPFHCNDKYPYKFTGAPAAGVTFKEPVARSMSIGQTESTMDVGFTASQAGKLTLSGELAFSVCTDDRCLVEKQPLSVTVDVKDAS